ncbi:ankyrin repeat domain-containing protein SOWAHA [Myripristis murdjan]|uniref:ankyrin repeat domain-containing protein SOWAHA n=1 Tax=Myripristis murdjan TaxID=586833 RepID=UPI0011761D0B|nr:ankyrin repeat domain-containing protein SOWAHA [Myripristis murdjan]
MALTQEAILSFLLEHGGKVKNSELLNNFRSQINCSDPAEKQHNRSLFKKFVNSVAVVKQIDDVKFVVVKKRCQDFGKDALRVASQKPQMDDNFSRQDASFSSTVYRGESSKVLYSDIENNNMCYPSNLNSSFCSDNDKHIPLEIAQSGRPLSRNPSGVDTTTVKVLNISSDQGSRSRKSGAVFAVIAVKSPPRPPAEPQLVRQDALPQHKTLEKQTMLVPIAPAPSVPAMNPHFPTTGLDGWSEPQCWKNRQIEEIQDPSFAHPMKTQNKTTKQGDDAKYSETVPLDPLAHEWLVKCAAGLWGQIYGLLLQETQLATRRDFMSGFTALHWAAKDGNGEMVHKIMDISKKRGTYVNVNSKTHGGYTPLHIAAIHGHSEVIVLLVQGYGANVNIRDNDGKKPCHYLGRGVSAEVRQLLGGMQRGKYRDKSESEECKEQPKGLNTISKLFQPHIGKKHKATSRLVQDW